MIPPKNISACMQKQRDRKKKIILGLTGSFGSGKSTVAGIFRSHGARLIDADCLAHRCLEAGSPAYKKIIKIFGTADREKLGKIVFSDKKLLKKLNAIIHPQVIREINLMLKKYKSGIIVLDAPLLLEAGLKKMVDKVIVVKIKRAPQLKRLRSKLGLTNLEILKRLNLQMPQERKSRLADFLIDNSGTIGRTIKQVQELRRKLWKS